MSCTEFQNLHNKITLNFLKDRIKKPALLKEEKSRRKSGPFLKGQTQIEYIQCIFKLFIADLLTLSFSYQLLNQEPFPLDERSTSYSKSRMNLLSLFFVFVTGSAASGLKNEVCTLHWNGTLHKHIMFTGLTGLREQLN